MQGSLANFLSPISDGLWLVLGLRPAVENAAGGVAQKRYVHITK
jgi:hypothetical protein